MHFNSYMIIQIIFFLSFLDETPDPYQRVYDLEHHVDDLEPEDLFQYSERIFGSTVFVFRKFVKTCRELDLENEGNNVEEAFKLQ